MWREFGVVVLVAVSLGSVVRGQYPPSRRAPECEEQCDPGRCAPAEGCEVGVVLDECRCCEVCAKKEYELCDHADVPHVPGVYHGICGSSLECRLRTDLEPSDAPEAVCYCITQETLCGTDQVTYNSICEMMTAAVHMEEKPKVQHKGPCREAPVIVSKPESVKDHTGNNVALICEASGFPIPTVEWIWTRVDGTSVALPSDDLHVSVNMRGGPEKWQITGWLQIMEMGKEHEGDYTCIAQNELGVKQATARVKVIEERQEAPRQEDQREPRPLQGDDGYGFNLRVRRPNDVV